MEADIVIKPKLAFSGLGWIGRNRLKAVADKVYAQIALLSDVSKDCLFEAMNITPASSIGSFEDILNNDAIDGIVIATPSAMHAEQAIAALKKKKAVFCQKPLGRNADEVKKVIQAAESTNRLLGVDFCYRYIQASQVITHIIRSGELGNVYAVDLKFHNAYGPDKPWFFDIKQSGGGCVLDLGVHMIDLMLYALDFPEVLKVRSNLYYKGTPVKKGKEVEDYAQATFQLQNDITATLSCSWNLHAGKDAEIEATFYGTNGAVAVKNINGSFYDFEALRFYGTKTEILTSPPDDWSGRALIRWVRNLAAETGFNKEASCYLPSAEVIDKIYER